MNVKNLNTSMMQHVPPFCNSLIFSRSQPTLHSYPRWQWNARFRNISSFIVRRSVSDNPTGSATHGKGGNVDILVGLSKTNTGGDVTINAGISQPKTGGIVSLSSGSGTISSSGSSICLNRD